MEILHVPDWYIAYTRPSRGRKVADRFSRKKIEHYCPMKKVKRHESGYSKTMYEPLFASYVFVYIAPAEHSRIKRIHGVVGLVHWRGKPAIIRNEEIDAIRRFLSFYNDIELEKIPVCTNDKISITHDPIKQGMLPEVMHDLVKLQLPSLGYALKARLSRELTNTDILQPENYQQSYI